MILLFTSVEFVCCDWYCGWPLVVDLFWMFARFGLLVVY